mgnify:CR=1 FL=1
MSKDLQVVGGRAISPTPTTPAFGQNGDNNTQIGYVGKYENHAHTVILVPNSHSRARSNGIQNLEINYDFYNLFVIGAETYQDSSFIVPKDRALTESTAQDIKDMCDALSPEAIEIIKTFPAIFASENHGYARTTEDHVAHYGYVLDVVPQDNGIKIYPFFLNEIKQQSLNLIAHNLGIAHAKSFNELNRTHWAIKRINLLEELERGGISVFKK